MFLLKFILVISLLFLSSCNKNMTKEEKEEMWSKAQTTGEIIERSGTKFNSGQNKSLALSDAQNRLSSGGGLLGEGGINEFGVFESDENKSVSAGRISMPVNPFLWKGALETVSFMPLNSADPMGGTILTDWYSSGSNENERCKLNIFISGIELKSQNLRVTSFCQNFENQKWVNTSVDSSNNIKIENAILNKAKKLRLQSS